MTTRRGRGEGTLPTKRPDGRWQARVRLPGGGRKSVYADTKEECGRKLRAVIREIDAGDRPIGDRLTFGAYAETWIERKRLKLAERTHTRYAGILRVHAIPTLGKVPLSKLRWEAIDLLLTSKGATLAPRTVHHLRAVIRSVLQSALKERLVRVNEAALTDAPRVTKTPVRATEPEEAYAILEAVRGDRLEALVTLALWTGCRQGELLALAWRDVDLDAGRFVVRRTLGLGRDAKGEPKFTEGAKTEKSVRTVRIRPSTVAVLREHRKRQVAERLVAGTRWHDYDLVFATTIGTPLHPGDLLRSFRRLLAAAGIPAMRWHDLRHAAATLLLLATDGDLSMVRDMLGHSTITLTADTYGHLTDRGRDRAAERLEALVMGSASR
jgi:integrase